MKKLNYIILLSSAALLAACGNGSNPSTSASVPASESVSQTSQDAPKAAKLEHSFISTAVMSYSNMRPTYNYYVTTFSFQTLELYDDASYKLTLSSSTFSAVILPEEGNNATANERANSLISYYGSYSAETDELDDDALVIDISVPTRIAGVDDEKGYIDTAAWTDGMKAKWADKTYEYDPETQQQKETGSKEYATGGEYLAAHSFSAVKGISAYISTGNMDTVDLKFGENSVSAQTKDSGVEHAFISTAVMSYSNMRPTYNYYVTTFSFQKLELNKDKTYSLTLSTSSFSAVILPEEGNMATANERANSLMTYKGTYSAEVDELDEDGLIISLSAPTAIVGVDDEKGYLDTENWTEGMKKAWADKTYEYDPETQQQKETGSKEYATGAEYLAAHSYAAVSDVGAYISTGNMDTIKLDFGK